MFEEDFSNVSDILPAGWSRNNNRWSVDIASNYTGGESPELKFVDGSSDNGEFRVSTDYIDASQASNLQLKFKHYVNDQYGSNVSYTLSVQIQREGEDTWQTEWFIQPTSNIFDTVIVDLNAFSGKRFKIAWAFGGSTYYINRWYIDDIVLEQI